MYIILTYIDNANNLYDLKLIDFNYDIRPTLVMCNIMSC